LLHYYGKKTNGADKQENISSPQDQETARSKASDAGGKEGEKRRKKVKIKTNSTLRGCFLSAVI
jgi:hypothetical protein